MKNEKEALQMFCDATEFREVFQSPFANKIDGKVYATDGVQMLIVEPNLIEGKFQERLVKIPCLDNRNEQTEIDFGAFDKAYENFELVPGMKYSDGTTDKDCPECNGTGKVLWEYEDAEGHNHSKEDYCPVCGGDGLKILPKVPTGRMVLPEHAAFNVNGVCFDAVRIMNCIKALRLLGYENTTWTSSSSNRMNIFRVAEGVTFVLMPVLANESKRTVVEVMIK